MPLTKNEGFITTLEKGNSIQIPVLIRWKNRLNQGELLSVYIRNPQAHESQRLYARMSGGRFTFPKLVAEVLEAEPGDLLEVTLSPTKVEEAEAPEDEHEEEEEEPEDEGGEADKVESILKGLKEARS